MKIVIWTHEGSGSIVTERVSQRKGGALTKPLPLIQLNITSVPKYSTHLAATKNEICVKKFSYLFRNISVGNSRFKILQS